VPIEFKAPQPTHRATRLPSSTVLDLAIGSGVNDIPLIRSYLVHADSVADARNSVAALKRNQPALFERRAVSPSYVRPQRSKHR
jgi:hypothetical protein